MTPPSTHADVAVPPSVAPAGETPETYSERERFATGSRCTCGDCESEFLSYYLREDKRGKVVRRRASVAWCPECGCRFENGRLQPCSRYHSHPRTGIRIQSGSSGGVSAVRLDPAVLDRLEAMFPGEDPFSPRMRPILEEIELYTRLHEMYPEKALTELQKVRRSMATLRCPRCGQPLPWRGTAGEVAPAPDPDLAPAPTRPRPRAVRRRTGGDTTADHLGLF
jgi:hypothetical protein